MDNKLEYIPGDLVMTNGVPLGTAKDVVYRVTSSDPSKTLELDDGTVTKGVQFEDNADCILAIHEFVGQETTMVNYEDKDNPYIKIETLEGTMKASVGDYIIKGVNG